jgi:hypothetical protein
LGRKAVDNVNSVRYPSVRMVEQPSEAIPDDVRQAFCDAVRLFDRWGFDTPAPTLNFRSWVFSLSGVCDLVLAYKNEPLSLDVHDLLLGLLDNLHMGLKAELTIDPSYAIGARCLDTLIQDRQAAVSIARSLSNQVDTDGGGGLHKWVI